MAAALAVQGSTWPRGLALQPQDALPVSDLQLVGDGDKAREMRRCEINLPA